MQLVKLPFLQTVILMFFLINSAFAQKDITNLGGAISAQHSDSPSGEEIDKVIDNQTGTKYLTFNSSGWIQFQSPIPSIVTRYTITSADDAEERDPKDWILEGSNNGTNWSTIDTQVNQVFTLRNQTRSFSFTNSTSYSYYRLTMTNNSGSLLQLAEWEIFGVTTGKVIIYQSINYKLKSIALSEGSYTTSDLVAKGIPDNWISSVKVPSGYKVTFYELDNFEGATLTKTADDPTLVDDRWNDKASSLIVALNDISSPLPPVYLRALGVDGSKIDLSWKDNSANESFFSIEQSTDATNFSSIATVPANSTTYSVSGLSAATKYYFRVRAKNEIGNSPYSNLTGAHTRETPPATFTDYIGGTSHATETMYLISYNDDVAFYGDQDFINTNRNQVDLWINSFVTGNWKYIKENYGSFGANRLYCLMHQNKFGGGTIASMFDTYSNGRNTIDVGSSDWSQSNFTLHEILTHEMGHIIEGSSHNIHESPFFSIWGDSKWNEIHLYDLYYNTGLADAQKVYDEMTGQTLNGVYWFRDWFYPLWKDYGQTQFLYNYFHLLAEYFPKRLENNTNFIYSRRANWGEFFYFMSGAAGVSLKAKATTVFGWSATTETEWNQAKINYPEIEFIGKDDSSQSEVFAMQRLGVTESENNNLKIKVSPNPTASYLTITLPESEKGKVKIKVYSSSHQLVRDFITRGNKVELNIGDLKRDVYTIEIQTSKLIHRQKIIKQ